MYFLIEFNFQARFRFTENWMSSTASSCIPSAHTCVQPAHYQHPAPEWYICYNRWTYTQHYQIVQCMLVHSCCWSLWVSRCMVTSSTIVESHTIVSLTDSSLLSKPGELLIFTFWFSPNVTRLGEYYKVLSECFVFS